METQQKNTVGTVLEQYSFDFAYTFEYELTEEEESLLHLLDDLNYCKFDSQLKRSRKFTPKQLMLVILYAAINGITSCRDIERLCNRDIFLQSILGLGQRIDHTTIARFIKANMEAIEDLFFQIVIKLGEEGELSKETVYQDGTKIESRANKYTFVWKSSLEKNSDKCMARLLKYAEDGKKLALIDNDIAVTEENVISVLEEAVNKVLKVSAPDIRGRGHKVPKEIIFRGNVVTDMVKLRQYDEYLELIGSNRKSLSKTDWEATFMRMKEDYMGNGQLKPGYNLQNALDSGYLVCCLICQDRTDYGTLIPMMDKIAKNLPWAYANYCADSGYDSIENFRYLKEKNIEAYIKSQNWEVSKKRAFKNAKCLPENMIYVVEDNYFICANNEKLTCQGMAGGRNKNSMKYACTEEACSACPFRKECLGNNRNTVTKKKHRKKDAVEKELPKYKQFTVTIEHMLARREADALLKTDFGIALRANRSIQAEGSFAVAKTVFNKRRFDSFGMDRAFTEWIIMATAYNVCKYASRMRRGLLHTSPFWYDPPLLKEA